jgi:hypothetical protein
VGHNDDDGALSRFGRGCAGGFAHTEVVLGGLRQRRRGGRNLIVSLNTALQPGKINTARHMRRGYIFDLVNIRLFGVAG